MRWEAKFVRGWSGVWDAGAVVDVLWCFDGDNDGVFAGFVRVGAWWGWRGC